MKFRALKLDWRYGLTELLIVVTGVLIALAADGWIRGRAERRVEQEYLAGIAADLASDTLELRVSIQLARDRAELGHAVIKAMDGDTVLTPIELATAVERTMWFSFPAYSRSTISDLMSTGNLRLLRDPEIKRRLSGYYQAIERGEQWSGNWRRIQMELESLLPEFLDLGHREALLARGDAMSGYAPDAIRVPWASDLAVTESEASQILARLRSTPEARYRIEGMVRIQGSQFITLSTLKTMAGDVLEAVEAVRNQGRAP